MSRHYGRSPHITMEHLNHSLLCAIDVETTGLVSGFHDIIELAIVPLDNLLKPNRSIKPFCVELKPKRPQNVDMATSKVHRINLAQLVQRALDPWDAVDIFIHWFEVLGLPLNSKIVPLAHNWPFDRNFIIDWIGQKSFDYYFDSRYRDTMVVANYLNDMANQRAERVPFPKVNLGYICNCLDIDHSKAHNAFEDCIMTAAAYRRMANSFKVIV